MSSITRRSLLGAGLTLPVAASLATASSAGRSAAPATARAGKLLVLGGTRFLGPPIVEAALAAGYDVTLFNRGRSDPGRFAKLEQIQGDRDTGDLSGLQGRKFDAVVDTSGYAPLHVQQACEALRDHVAHYVFVSTVSVYPDQSAANVDEKTPTSKLTAEAIAAATTIREGSANYGPMKAECERAAESAMPGRVTIVRPGLIVGPDDSSDRFTYWPARVARGGEVLAPPDPDAEVQFIDVRDLAAWMVHCLEERVVGVFNADGFAGRVSMAEFLHACKAATSTPVTFTWGSEEFLTEHEVGPWMAMPLWLPRAGNTYAVNDKARAQGLTFRPLADTIRDTLHWAKAERGDRPFARTGVKPEREQELLALLRDKR